MLRLFGKIPSPSCGTTGPKFRTNPVAQSKSPHLRVTFSWMGSGFPKMSSIANSLRRISRNGIVKASPSRTDGFRLAALLFVIPIGTGAEHRHHPAASGHSWGLTLRAGRFRLKQKLKHYLSSDELPTQLLQPTAVTGIRPYRPWLSVSVDQTADFTLSSSSRSRAGSFSGSKKFENWEVSSFLASH